MLKLGWGAAFPRVVITSMTVSRNSLRSAMTDKQKPRVLERRGAVTRLLRVCQSHEASLTAI